MKIKALILSAAAVIMMTSCSTLNSITSLLGKNVDFTNGTTAGSVISNLSSQFLKFGNIDLSSAQNLLNIGSLANALTSLKNNNTQGVQNFAQGLVNGSNNLINNTNIDGVLNGLGNLSKMNLGGLSGLVQNGASSSKEVDSIKSGLTGILSLFKK